MKETNYPAKVLLSNALGSIDLAYVEEAAEPCPVAKTNARPKRLPQWSIRLLPVACLFLIVAIALPTLEWLGGDRDITCYPGTDKIGENLQGVTVHPASGENAPMTLPSTNPSHLDVCYGVGFPLGESEFLMGYEPSHTISTEGALVKVAVEEITAPKYAAYRAGHVLDEGYVGERLDQVEVKTYWRNMLTNDESDVTYVKAEVYAIEKVETDAAVCVRYLEEGVANTTVHYYIYTNSQWSGNSLEELVEDFDLHTHMGMNFLQAALFLRDEDGSEEKTRLSFTQTDTEEILQMIYPLRGDAKPLKNVEELDGYIADAKRQGQLFFRAYSMGNHFHVAQVFDNGYLMLLREGNVYLFEIGEESAKQILERMEALGTALPDTTASPEETVSYMPA